MLILMIGAGVQMAISAWINILFFKFPISDYKFQVMNFVQISSTHFSPFEIQSQSSPAMSCDSLFRDQNINSMYKIGGVSVAIVK